MAGALRAEREAAYLAGLLKNRPVECREVECDRYGRSVSVCYAGSNDLSIAIGL
jgi:endonuclease YncB( thermonuclease family)